MFVYIRNEVFLCVVNNNGKNNISFTANEFFKKIYFNDQKMNIK